MSYQGALYKKFSDILVRNATKTPPSVCKTTPSVCTEPPLYGNSREFPIKGRSRAGNSNGNSSDSRSREFPLWKFQVTNYSSVLQTTLLHYSYLEFPLQEKSLGNSRNTREFPGIQGNPGNPRLWLEDGAQVLDINLSAVFSS